MRIGAVNIDDAALVAYVGNPTAQWAQQALPGALAQAFGARMAPGDPGAVPLNISLNTLYLGGGGPADPDRMTGVATVGGHAISVHAVSTYISNPDRSGAAGAGSAGPGAGAGGRLRLPAEAEARGVGLAPPYQPLRRWDFQSFRPIRYGPWGRRRNGCAT